MTEKRFDFKYEYITLDEGVFATAKDKQNAELISRTLNQLSEENEQLKQTLRIYRKVANCRNCDYHDYDCREYGDDFEICTKGNDMEDGICEDWREL